MPAAGWSSSWPGCCPRWAEAVASGGKEAYLNKGSLQVIVMPEPEGLALAPTWPLMSAARVGVQFWQW